MGTRKRKTAQALALLITLWVVVVLSMLAYTLAYQLQTETKLTLMEKQRQQAMALARAGLSKAICDLRNDLLFDVTEKRHVFDSEGDLWYKQADKTDVELATGAFSVVLIDEERKINLNKAHPRVLEELLKTLEVEEEDAEKITAAIVDWRDADDIPYGKKEEQQLTEDQHYTQLILEEDEEGFFGDVEEDTLLYHCKNDNFTTVLELLEVQGIDDSLLFGYYDDEERYHPGLGDLLTVDSAGPVNVNTASKEVLQAIIGAGVAKVKEPEVLAEAIVEFRRQDQEGDDITDENAFRDLGHLTKVTGIDGVVLSSMRAVQPLEVASRIFTIISTGLAGDIEYTLKALVERRVEYFRRTERMEEEEQEWRTKFLPWYSRTSEQLRVKHFVVRLKTMVEL